MKKRKILLIEDNASILEEITTLLQLEGYHVIEVENGLEGIEMAEQKLPDLILCDICLQGSLNGFDILRALRENSLTSHIRFVFMTGMPPDEFVRELSEYPFTGYLRKPFHTFDLLKIIEKTLNDEPNISPQPACQ